MILGWAFQVALKPLGYGAHLSQPLSRVFASPVFGAFFLRAMLVLFLLLLGLQAYPSASRK